MIDGEKFRPASAVIASIIAYLLLALMVIETIISSSAIATILTFIVATAIGCGIYFVMHRPYIVVGDDGIEIVNPISRHTVYWRDVESIDTKFTMSITTRDRVIHAWAAPAGGRYHVRNIHPSEVRGTSLDGQSNIAHSDSPRSDSGVAAHIARIKWNEYRARH